jgi:anti-anti-sigma factor
VQILEIETEVADGLARIALKGELDLSTVNKVEEELESLEASGAQMIVLDLSSLSFLDSTGLRCLVTADQRAKESGRRLVLVRGPDAVQRVFTITRLEERLEMVDDAASITPEG